MVRLFDNSRITQVRHLSDFLIIVVIPALIVSIGGAPIHLGRYEIAAAQAACRRDASCSNPCDRKATLLEYLIAIEIKAIAATK